VHNPDNQAGLHEGILAGKGKSDQIGVTHKLENSGLILAIIGFVEDLYG